MKKLSLIIMTTVAVLISCSGIGASENITPEKAKEMIGSGSSDLLILDVRTKREYDSGHLKGAKLIPIDLLGAKIKEIESYRNKDVIVYCAVGGRSSRGTALLIKRKFSKVYNMDGGIKEWGRLGFEIEK